LRAIDGWRMVEAREVMAGGGGSYEMPSCYNKTIDSGFPRLLGAKRKGVHIGVHILKATNISRHPQILDKIKRVSFLDLFIIYISCFLVTYYLFYYLFFFFLILPLYSSSSSSSFSFSSSSFSSSLFYPKVLDTDLLFFLRVRKEDSPNPVQVYR
jgi:hypothetical protein